MTFVSLFQKHQLKNVVVLDVETTTKQKGNPHVAENKLITIQTKAGNSVPSVFTKETFDGVSIISNNATCVIGFNLKFDLAWIRRELGITVDCVWDCQLAEFLFSNQNWKYPSLEETCILRGVDKKLDIVKTEYWDRSCSCHVSLVEKILLSMQKVFVTLVITESTEKQDLVEHLKNDCGRKTIQSLIDLLKNGDVKSLLIVMKQRLEHIVSTTKENTNYQTLIMIDLWLKQHALFVEQQVDCALTTTTQQERLETDCVSIVMLLWDILKSQTGWGKHKNTCENTPIDTDMVPIEILSEYGAQDVESTYQVFLKQLEMFQTTHKHLFRLFRLHCNDLLVLQEMEDNGLVYDEHGSLAASQSYDKQIADLEGKIRAFAEYPNLNIDSGDHKSCLLYGGTIIEETRLPMGVYKTGAKVGQVRYKIVHVEHVLPRLVEPLKGSELKKEGYFSTEESTLLSLRPKANVKKLIHWLLERSKIIKLKSTYLEGLPGLREKMGWTPNMLYPNYNQCMAKTGRLSSTKPNSQNLPKEAKRFFISRFD